MRFINLRILFIRFDLQLVVLVGNESSIHGC